MTFKQYCRRCKNIFWHVHYVNNCDQCSICNGCRFGRWPVQNGTLVKLAAKEGDEPEIAYVN